MIIKIRIKTPIGQAEGTEKKIRKFLLPHGVVPKIEINDVNNMILWTVDVDTRRATRIYKNVGAFDSIITNILSSNLLKKYAKKGVGEQGLKEVEDMLKNHTTCEILKN